MSNPTLIFCPGAWYPTSAFDPLIEKLPEYTTHTVALPSIQQATTVKDLQPDIKAIRDIVESECDAGHDVVVVSHSWSGLPVNSALDGLSKSERGGNGQKGGVVKIIFLSAFIPDVGQSLIASFGGTAPDWYIMDVGVIFLALNLNASLILTFLRKQMAQYQHAIHIRCFSTMLSMATSGRRRCGRMRGLPKCLLRPVLHI